MTIQNRTYDLFLAICRCLLPVQCIAQVTIVISGRIFIGIHHHLGTDLCQKNYCLMDRSQILFLRKLFQIEFPNNLSIFSVNLCPFLSFANDKIKERFV